jgi:hypothetical protein
MVEWEISFHRPTLLPVWMTVNFWFETDEVIEPTSFQCMGFVVGYVFIALVVAFNIIALHDLVTRWSS